MAVWHSIELLQVSKELDTDFDFGLTEDEVVRRLETYGYNELEKEERISPFSLFIRQFKNVLIVILLIAIVLSAVIGELIDAGIITVIVIFCAVLGFTQEYRAERALEALKKMLSPTIAVLREGREEEIPSNELVPSHSAALYGQLNSTPGLQKILEELGDSSIRNYPDVVDMPQFYDPWGTVLDYRYVPGDNFPELVSAGPDKVLGNADDKINR